MIQIKNLKKSYGNVDAVKGITFNVDKGSLFAFLGPNGAGKSTTINMITTLLKKDEGTVLIDGYELGKDDDKIKNTLGVVFQDSVLDDKLTVRENLAVRASFYQLDIQEAIMRVSEQVDLHDFLDRYYEQLSGGQRRRVDIARALLHNPKLLVLDEPTTGLDPQTRQKVWEVIETLQKEKGMTVFLTTHYMEEAAKADYVIVIDEGNLVAQGTAHALKTQYSFDTLKLYPTDTEKIMQHLKHDAKLNSDKSIHVKLNHTMEALAIIESLKPYISGFEVVQGTLDDAFIEITGKEIR